MGGKLVPYVWRVQKLDWRGGLGGLPTSLVVLSVVNMCRTLFLLPSLQKWQLHFWSFRIFCPEFVPTMGTCSYF